MTIETSGLFKKYRPARPQPVLRAERTGVIRERSRPEEGQVCEPEGPENWRERRWRLFSVDPKKTRREQVALPPAVLLAGLSNYFFFVAAFALGLAAAFFFGAAFFFVTAKSLTSFH